MNIMTNQVRVAVQESNEAPLQTVYIDIFDYLVCLAPKTTSTIYDDIVQLSVPSLESRITLSYPDLFIVFHENQRAIDISKNEIIFWENGCLTRNLVVLV